MMRDTKDPARETVGCLVDLFGLALVAAGVLGTMGALTLSVIQAMPWLQVASTLVLSGVIVLCRWRG
ncbi:MAG TPA: hypothetical protein VM487_08340 [Phycisphaerae bacterium]|nr:hypothetical protein [Phycisphaerae bacterium]